MDKSAETTAGAVSVSVALLLPGVESVTPAGAATLAVFAKLPVVAGSTVPLIVKVAVPVLSRSTVTLMSPVPLAGQVPLAAVHVQVAPVMLDGIVSVTVAPVTSLGPPLLTVTVYVIGAPGV